jgi:predicted hotdog family 3-hydroxylacyl-ACP dehydratase
VPSFIAIEYIAQAIAAWAGYRGKFQSQPVKVGLLLGIRDFKASVDYMPVGATVQVRAQRIMEMANGMAVFDGWITGDDIEISGRLSVLSVESLESLDSSLT